MVETTRGQWLVMGGSIPLSRTGCQTVNRERGLCAPSLVHDSPSDTSPAPPRERRDRRDQLAGIDRLGEMHLEAAAQRLGAIFRARESRQRGGGNVANRRVVGLRGCA